MPMKMAARAAQTSQKYSRMLPQAQTEDRKKEVEEKVPWGESQMREPQERTRQEMFIVQSVGMPLKCLLRVVPLASAAYVGKRAKSVAHAPRKPCYERHEFVFMSSQRGPPRGGAQQA